MGSQFRKLNRPTLYDLLWNGMSRIWYRRLFRGVFFEARSLLYRFHSQVDLGEEVYIKRNAIIGCATEFAEVKIGRRTTIGFNVIIIASESIVIGADCMIAPNVYIVDSNHGIKKNELFSSQENVAEKVYIDSNCWIGTGAIILAGVRVCSDVVIAAGSVVTTSIVEPGIYGGVPARLIAHD